MIMVLTMVNQSVACLPSVGVNHGFKENFTGDYRNQFPSGASSNDGDEDLSAAFENPENESFFSNSTTSFTTDSANTDPASHEVTFIQLDFPEERNIYWSSYSMICSLKWLKYRSIVLRLKHRIFDNLRDRQIRTEASQYSSRNNHSIDMVFYHA